MEQALSYSLTSTVGALANGDVTVLRKSESVGECLARLRQSFIAERIVYFYVTDDENRLCGVVPTRRLLHAPLDSPVRSIMLDRVVALEESQTVAEALEEFLHHRFLSLPVVTQDNRLVGTLDVTTFAGEIGDLLRRNQTESIFQLIGLHLTVQREGPVWRSFLDRFPWLLANISGGIVCALIAGMYESLLEAVVVLAMFLPVTLAVAESVSIQSASLTLAALSQGLPQRLRFARMLGREFLVAVLLGTACGFLVAASLYLWKGMTIVALAVWISILCSMVTACILGVALPTLVRYLGRDPKVAAGPITLATADIATLLFYFNLTGIILNTLE